MALLKPTEWCFGRGKQGLGKYALTIQMESNIATVYAFLHLWYKFEVRKFTRFVKFTFRVK